MVEWHFNDTMVGIVGSLLVEGPRQQLELFWQKNNLPLSKHASSILQWLMQCLRNSLCQVSQKDLSQKCYVPPSFEYVVWSCGKL